jgi:hypothetical protein
MIDLGFSGLHYTLDNRQRRPNNIKVRLDRGLGDNRCMEVFNNMWIQHIKTCHSLYDLWFFPLLNEKAELLPVASKILCTINCSNWLQGNTSTFYENMWSEHERYNETVEMSWLGSRSHWIDCRGHYKLGAGVRAGV